MASIPWVKSYDAAVQKARTSKKLLMVDFYTDWCGYCKKLDAEVYTDPKVIQFCSQLVPVKLDAEREGRSLAMKYRVSGFPTVLYIDAEGAEWGRMPGFLPSKPFIEFAQGILKEAREQPLLEAKLRQAPSNTGLAVDLTQRFARQGSLQKALWAGGLVTKAPQSPSMARAYVSLGGMFFDRGNPTAAQPWFSRAVALSTDPRDRGYSHLGLGLCALSRKDKKTARTELSTILKIPNCPQSLQDKARQILQQLDS